MVPVGKGECSFHHLCFVIVMSFFKTGTWYLLRNMGFVSASMFAGDWVCQKILHPNEPWYAAASVV